MIDNDTYDEFYEIFFNNKKLSYRALGIYCYIQKNNSSNHSSYVTVRELITNHSENRDAILTALKELINSGLISREELRDPKSGKYRGVIYSLID